MRKISTSNITAADLVLADDVMGTGGNILLGKGTVITPALGRRIRNFGVEFVFVEGECESDEYANTNAMSAEEVRENLQNMFAGTLGNPRMKKLFDAVCRYKLQKLTGDTNGAAINS